MARRPQGSVRRSPRLKQGKPKSPGKGRPSPKPKKTAGPVDMPKRTKIGKTINPKLGLPPKMPVTRKAMGGEAREGVARAELKKKRKTARQQELMDMLNRLYGKQKIVPKKKPKKQ